MIFPIYGENHSVLPSNPLTLSVVFIDFLIANPASIPAVNVGYHFLHVVGFSLLIFYLKDIETDLEVSLACNFFECLLF